MIDKFLYRLIIERRKPAELVPRKISMMQTKMSKLVKRKAQLSLGASATSVPSNTHIHTHVSHERSNGEKGKSTWSPEFWPLHGRVVRAVG